MIRIDGETEVEASPEAAFAFVTRLQGFPAWLPGVLAAEALDAEAVEDAPAAPRAGSRFRLVSEGPGGIRIVSEGRVEAVDPPRSITIAASSGFFALTASCAIVALSPVRSRVDVRAAIEPRGLATLASGRIEQELRAAVPDTLRRLREALEGADRDESPDRATPASPAS